MVLSAAAGPMWALSLVGAIIGAAAIPALGVYGPELFPTSLRGKANGLITVAAVAGHGHRPAGGRRPVRPLGRPRQAPRCCCRSARSCWRCWCWLAYPETAHRELEELNPEDPSLSGAAGASPGGPPTR